MTLALAGPEAARSAGGFATACLQHGQPVPVSVVVTGSARSWTTSTLLAGLLPNVAKATYLLRTYLATIDARRLMATWLRASVLEGFADATFIPDAPRPRAFCTLKYHDDKVSVWGTSIAQLVLAIASPESGNGLVGTVSEINYHLKDRGVEHVFFTTQASNRRAVRVGEHLGFKYGKTEHVFRTVL